jgi:acetyltransferase-like isoleucine patch superfamily enzyme
MIGRIKALAIGIYFRLIHRTFGGTLIVSSCAIEKCQVGTNFRLRGKLAIDDAVFRAKSDVNIGQFASVAVADGGQLLLGCGVVVGARTTLSVSKETLQVGNRTTFATDCLISGSIMIGDDCLFARNVTILSATHQLDGASTIRENDKQYLSDGGSLFQRVTIGDDCWLGVNSVVLPGVSLAKGTVVGANAVVTSDTSEYSIVAGAPARVIGRRKRGSL